MILGSGSAACAAAITASELGAQVAMTEAGTVGGTCVNIGCIPSKNVIQAAELFYNSSHSGFRGIQMWNRKLDCAALIQQKDQLARKLRQKKYIAIATGDEGITIVNGHAQCVSTHQVRVGDRVVKAPQFLIATGSRACLPPFRGIDQVTCLTSTEALGLKKLPQSMIIIGGGFIALE